MVVSRLSCAMTFASSGIPRSLAVRLAMALEAGTVSMLVLGMLLKMWM